MIKLSMKCSNIKVEADVSKLLVSYDQKSKTQKNSIDNDVKLTEIHTFGKEIMFSILAQ